MAARRMTRESFDALMQVKAKRHCLDRSDPIDEALHQLRVHSRPAQRTQYEDGDFHEERKYLHSDWRGKAREAPKEDYLVPPYQSEEEDYCTHTCSRNQDYVQAPSRDQDYGRLSSVERELAGPSTRERSYGRLASRERNYGRVSSQETSRLRDADYSSAELLSGFHSPGLLEEEFGAVRSQDYNLEYGLEAEREFAPSLYAGRDLTAKHILAPQGLVKSKTDAVLPMKKWVQALSSDDLLGEPADPSKRGAFPAQHLQLGQRLPLPLRGTLQSDDLETMRYARHKEPQLDISGPLDIFTTFGVEIINWAGFHKIKKDPEYMEMYRILFKLETETCAKMLASFKCSLKMEHKDFCYSIVRTLQHPALQTPKVDGQFLNLLLEKKLVATKNGFFQLIKPFDRYMMYLQDCLLRSTVPLLMACNAYELSCKSSIFSDPVQMAATFKTTASLCRKSLVLIGQTFALASSFRQEKILEAIGLKEVAPLPILFPNFDTSALFGKEYIEHLQGWLEKSRYQMQLKKPSAETPSPQGVPETRPKIKIPQRADRKVTETIEKMVDGIISGTLKGKERAQLKDNPEYWFLKEEDSLEHKYYKLKLSEMYRLMSAAKEKPKQEKTPELQDLAVMRVLLRARKVLHIKKRLFWKRRPRILQRWVAKPRRLKRATVGTQTLLMLKQQHLPQSPKAHPAETSLEKAGVCDSATDPEDVPGEGLGAGSSLGIACQFPDVDPKTMVTAKRLAKFVAEVGPEIEQFSIDNSTDNPDLWFLHDRESSAFRFYRMKVSELCPSINFSAIPGPASKSPAPSEGDWENNKEEEKEEEEEAPQSGMEEEEAQAGFANVGASSTAGEGQPEGTTSEASAQGPLRGSTFGRKRASSRSLKVGLIPASKRVCLIDEPKVHDPIRIAYDRPHGYQSHKNKWQKSKDLEFSHKRLNQKNIGFQMLQKMGWKEGLGLGAHGKGIKDPVKVGSTSAGEGLGVAGDKNKEDTFSTFRQRMIQMYYLKRACNK